MLLSIIVPVYNTRPWLRECLDSLMAQSEPNYELVIVDDGSTDGSGAICDEYAARDARIQVIHQPNEGLCSARNAGLDKVRGDYITFVDADDVVHPELVRCVYEGIRLTSADLLWWKWQEFVEHVELAAVQAGTPREIPSDEMVWEIIEERGPCCGYACNKAFRRGFLGNMRFEEIGGTWEDVLFSFNLLVESGLRAKCFALDCVLYGYRQREGSIVRTFSNKTLQRLQVGDQICDTLAALSMDEVRRRSYINELLRAIVMDNKRLFRCRVNNQRWEWERLDALWRKYERFYAYDRFWTRGFIAFRLVQKLSVFCREKGIWIWR